MVRCRAVARPGDVPRVPVVQLSLGRLRWASRPRSPGWGPWVGTRLYWHLGGRFEPLVGTQGSLWPRPPVPGSGVRRAAVTGWPRRRCAWQPGVCARLWVSWLPEGLGPLGS